MIFTVRYPDTVFLRPLKAGAAVSPVTEEHGWRFDRVADPFERHGEIGLQLVA